VVWILGSRRRLQRTKGGTVWSDKKARLVDIASKGSATHDGKWEEQYAELEAHAGMPVVGTKLPN
jgi:hypothetical protein